MMGCFRYGPMEPDAYLAEVVLSILQRDQLSYTPPGEGSWGRLRGVSLEALAAAAGNPDTARELRGWAKGARAGGHSKSLRAVTPILAAVGEWERMRASAGYGLLGQSAL